MGSKMKLETKMFPPPPNRNDKHFHFEEPLTILGMVLTFASDLFSLIFEKRF